MPDNQQPSRLLSALIVAAGSLVGAFLAFSLFCSHLLRYTLRDAAWDCSVVSTGAVLGGLFFSWASKR
jgi:hypothetical protein